MKELKKYLENGIGFNCDTSELKELSIKMKQSNKIHLENLKYLENEKQKLLNTEISNDALGIINQELIANELEKIRKEINLIVIALRFNSIDEFIQDKIK